MYNRKLITIVGSLMILVTLALLVFVLVGPARATEPAATDDSPASITELAVYRNPSATDADQVIYVAAGSRSWKIKKAAAQIDAQVDGLTIVTGVAGSCYRAPTALCVDVVTGNWDKAQQRALAGYDQTWRGLMTYEGEYHRTIYLNWSETQARYAKGIATHELGHALGLNHDNWGRMSVHNTTAWFTDSEVALLRSWYGEARYR